MRVLLFQPGVEEAVGHQRTWVFTLATDMRAAGHDVHILTTTGIASPLAPAVPTYAMGRTTRRAAAWAADEMERRHRRQEPPRFMWWLLVTVEQAAYACAIRRRASRLGRSTGVLVVGMRCRYTWLAVMAPLRGRWAGYQWHTPRRDALSGRFRRRWSLAGAVEAVRRRCGGSVRLAVNNPTAGVVWQARHPWAHIETIPSATRRRADPAPRDEARTRLGLAPDATIALHLGHATDLKMIDVIAGAFSGPDAPADLVLAGSGVGARFLKFRLGRPDLSFPRVHLRDGYQSEDDKHLLHSAADVVVLGFRPGRYADSGALSDAISYGVPVVCNSGTVAGDLINRFGVGKVCAPDAGAMAAAVRDMLNSAPSRRGFDRYLAEWDPSETARRLVALVSPSG